MEKEFECLICGIEVIPENQGASTINGNWVHNNCIIGSDANLKYALNEEE